MSDYISKYSGAQIDEGIELAMAHKEAIEALSADSSVTTAKIANSAVTRAKLANDALYSPISYVETYDITVADLGKTLASKWNTAATFTLKKDASILIPTGAEIAIMRLGVNDAEVRIVGDGVRFAVTGEKFLTSNISLRMTDSMGMVALKKFSGDQTNGDAWLVTGNVEVV